MIKRVAFRAPAACGAKATVTVQLVPPASAVPQVFVCVKSPGLVPATVILLIGTDATPEFVTVIDFPALALPTLVEENARVLGVKVIAVPVPVIVTT